MRKHFSAVIFCTSSISLICLSSLSYAQSTTVKLPNKPPPAVGATSTAAVTPPSEKPPEKSPIRLVYSAEYDGNKLGGSLIQTPSGDAAGIAHDVKLGYAVTDRNVIGIREKVIQNLETSQASPDVFVPKDWRVFVSWSKMMETSDLEIHGTFDVFLPTSEKSRLKGLITNLRFTNVWIPKTQLRNWNISFLTIVQPQFYKNPALSDDLFLLFAPMITVDIFPQTHIYFELDLDAGHKNTANFLDFHQADPDAFTIGPQFDINSHLTVYPALKFYVGDMSFKTATLYFNLEATL